MDTHAPKDDFGIDDEEVRSLLDGIKRLGGLDDELESRLVELLCVGGQSAGEASHMGAKARPILESVPRIQSKIQARSRELDSQFRLDLETAETKERSFWEFLYDLRMFVNEVRHLPNPVGSRSDPALGRLHEAFAEFKDCIEGLLPLFVLDGPRHEPRPRAREAPTFGRFTATVIPIARVQEVIAAHQLFGQPISEGEVLPGARDQLRREAVGCWQQPLEILDQHLSGIARDQVLALLGRTLHGHKDTELFRKLSDHVEEVLVRLAAEQSQLLADCYEVESSTVMTFDFAALQAYETKELGRLQAQRHPKPRAAVTDGELGPDPMRSAIGTAACVCGYYMLASARFIDTVCMKFVHNMSKMMQSEFGSGRLEQNFPPRLGTHAAAERARFEAQKATLDGAAKTLDMFVQEHQPKEQALGLYGHG